MLRSAALARRFFSSGAKVNKVGVIGAGLMGSGIAQISAAAGQDVVLVDMRGTALEGGLKRIKGSLGHFAKKAAPGEEAAYVDNVMGKIQGADAIDALADCDLIVEAIVENMDVKKNLFADLGKVAKQGAILSSNTSSLSVTEMGAASGRPESMVGLHFFNPVPLMALVEVVNTAATSPEILQGALDWSKSVGKKPITCKDTPGFVVNRLLVPYLSESIRLLERGVASKEDIDLGMRLGAGHPMGPIHLGDYVGLDTCLFILEGWSQAYPEEQIFQVPDTLRKLVEEGKTGRKVGQGFYKWDGDRVVKE